MKGEAEATLGSNRNPVAGTGSMNSRGLSLPPLKLAVASETPSISVFSLLKLEGEDEDEDQKERWGLGLWFVCCCGRKSFIAVPRLVGG